MNCKEFIERQINDIRETVGSGTAINALSGGVDSSVVTVLGHRALGNRLKTMFVDNAIMREGEPQRVVRAFARLRIPVQLVDARSEFLRALNVNRAPLTLRVGEGGTIEDLALGIVDPIRLGELFKP